MGQALILETTFLIDLEREFARASAGRAQEFLERHPSDRLFITPTIAGELAAGLSLHERQRWEEFVAPFRILPHTRDVSWEYGCTFRYLHGSGQRIGGNDLWIAAAALAYDMPVVTRNVRDYRRVPRLRIIEYVKPQTRPVPG